jgi:hypothetical protein
MLDASVASVNSALQCARATLAKETPAGRPSSRAVPDDQQRALLERYVRSCESADLDGFVALLTEDAVLGMPPWQERNHEGLHDEKRLGRCRRRNSSCPSQKSSRRDSLKNGSRKKNDLPHRSLEQARSYSEPMLTFSFSLNMRIRFLLGSIMFLLVLLHHAEAQIRQGVEAWSQLQDRLRELAALNKERLIPAKAEK